MFAWQTEAEKEDPGSQQTLENICCNGWPHEERVGHGSHYVFGSPIQWWQVPGEAPKAAGQLASLLNRRHGILNFSEVEIDCGNTWDKSDPKDSTTVL